jgi:hypothetical protein
MRGNRHFIVPNTNLQLLKTQEEWIDNTILYEWGTKMAKRRFCKTCGILPFYTPRSNPNGVGVTLACVDFGENKPTIVYKEFDGIHWEEGYKASSISDEA